MSGISLRSHIQEGVAELGLQAEKDVIRTVDGLTTLASSAVSDLQGEIKEHDETGRLIANAAFICAGILHAPGLKLPGSKIVSDQNAQLLREVTKKQLDPTYPLDITVALGGSEDAASLRLPAYVGPALDIAQLFVDRDIEAPVVRIVAAYDISATLNGLNRVVAKRRADEAYSLIEHYAHTFYPDLTTAGLIKGDAPTMDDMRNAGLEADAKLLHDLMTCDEADLQSPHLEIAKTLKGLERASQKRSSGGYDPLVVAAYSAAHGITFRNYATTQTGGAIKIGGQGEAPFDAIQAYMTGLHADDDPATLTNINAAGRPQPISLRNKAGLLPPYYTEGPDEVTIDTPIEQRPVSFDDLTDHYKRHGLRSGSDFAHLPEVVKDGFAKILQANLQMIHS